MLRVAPTTEELVLAAAEIFCAAAEEGITARGRFLVALAGGGTPRPLYQLLARPPWRDRIDWSAVHVFWGDERCVPADDSRSNQLMVRETLLDGAPVPSEQVHPIDGTADPAAAATAYDRVLREYGQGAVPRFDLILLGLGTDGHTASLFPGDSALAEVRHLAAATDVAVGGVRRVTMTLPVLNAAEQVAFLVSGRAKAPVLHRILKEAAGAELPAGLVRPENGELVWLVDAAAVPESLA